MRKFWRDVEKTGKSWDDLCEFVGKLPAGKLWRYAVVGDLPGIGESVDRAALFELVGSNEGRRGFGFTHKRSREAIESASDATILGLTMNLSANNLVQADELREHGQVATALPLDAPLKLRTPKGYTVITCPATYRDDVNCSRCGLCASTNPKRPIIGFPAHGLRKREVSLIAGGVS